MLVVLDEFEREARRRRYGQLRELMAADTVWQRNEQATAADRAAGRGDADAAIQRFLLDQDIAQLRATLDGWSRQHRTFGFAGPNGAMVLNQLADGALAPESAALLAELTRVPADPADAEARIDRFIEHARYRREQGSNLAAGRAVPFLSWFWWMTDPERWPVLWSASTFAAFSTQLGWLPANLPLDQQAPLYSSYREQCLDLGRFAEVEETMVWFVERDPVIGLDPSLQQRCVRAAELQREPGTDDAEWELNRTNVRVLLAELKRAGRTLAPIIEEQWGFPIRVQDKLTEFWDGSSKRLRCDSWVAWVPADRSPTARMTLLVNDTGVYLGLDLFANTNPKGWFVHVREALRQRPVAGYEVAEPPYAAFPDYGRTWRLQARQVLLEELVSPDGLRSTVTAGARAIEDNLRFTWTVSGTAKPAAGVEQEPAPPVTEDRETRVALAADRLFLPQPFLAEIVEMLSEKGQVIFHGPPGTGKTFVALALAEAITGDAGATALVQFHPSTGYEDFIEGYRPQAREDGSLSYQLVPGPLRLLADQAAANPEQTFMLIIDEINRANLPKVFGELLFLLEYRGQAARPLYRPDEAFVLPRNLWIIGTMNTADRSIALVDAALRRRFHFVEFVPDQRGDNPVNDVLKRWAGAEERGGRVPDWLPEFVDEVNQELRADLVGDHLLLGPSYFMRDPLDQAVLRKIWSRNIEPLLKDVFFGDQARIAKYRFDTVWERFGHLTGAATEAAVEQP